jgi:hypothetical protein
MRSAILSLAVLCCAQIASAQGTSSSTPGPATEGSTATYSVIPSGQSISRKQFTSDADVRPFSTVGIALKITTAGPGFDLATPLSRNFNLRGSAMFFDYGHDFETDGIQYNGELKFNAGMVNLDWFPKHGAFHISPGMLILKSDLSGVALVPGGSTFTLNDVDYTSSFTDPVHGNGGLVFPHAVGPSLMVGWGNIIPRSGKHWSVPFEIGAAYMGTPKVNLNFVGTACQGGGCSSIATDPETQTNLRAEEKLLNDDVKALQFYPLVSLGVSYKF